MATVSAWPICKLPVTFGGGHGKTKSPSAFGLPSGPNFGSKKPCLSHQSYHAASTARGSYPAAIVSSRSVIMRVSNNDRASDTLDSPFLSPAGVVFTKAAACGLVSGSGFFFSFAALGAGAPAPSCACLADTFAANLAAFSARFAAFLANIGAQTMNMTRAYGVLTSCLG